MWNPQVKSVVLQNVLGMSWMFEVPTVRLKVRSPCPSLTLWKLQSHDGFNG